jgi:hypothetical protein
METTVKFLGHLVSENGVIPCPSTVDKKVNYKKPTSAAEVKSFLGLVSFFRSFIKNFATIAYPLMQKTLKENSKNFTWNDSDDKTFEYLRNCLLTPPIKSHPRFDLPFEIECDASGVGLGCILTQVQEGKRRVIAYASRQLKPVERRYSSIEREALAVIFSIKQFKYYLLDNPVIIRSDARPLMWLQNFKDEASRLGRWSMQLQSINYTIQYKPGRENGAADALSRIPICNIAIQQKIIDIKKYQNADLTCQKISKYLNTGELDDEDKREMPIWAKEIVLYRIIDGILYREDVGVIAKRRNDRRLQLVVPYCLRRLILKECHESDMAAHEAFLRTYLRVAEKYYWSDFRQDIKLFYQTCLNCTANASQTERSLLNPLELAT